MRCLSGGGFEFAHSGVTPQFNPTKHWPDDTDDDEVIDLTVNADGGRAPGVDGDATAETKTVATATGDEEYAVDWDGVAFLDNPTHAAAKLMHRARQMLDTSRWWTMRWPSNAISLLSFLAA